MELAGRKSWKEKKNELRRTFLDPALFLSLKREGLEEEKSFRGNRGRLQK